MGEALNTATLGTTLTNTTSKQDKSMKQCQWNILFCLMIQACILDIILLNLNNFPQSEHVSKLVIMPCAETSCAY